MNTIERIYVLFSRLLPAKYLRYMKGNLRYAGERVDVRIFLGSINLFAYLVTVIILLYPLAIKLRFDPAYLPYALSTYLAVHLLFYLVVYFKIEDRGKRIEDNIPNMLNLLAANLRAGMTPFQALKKSSRKEFGPLQEEIDYATRHAYGTEPFQDTIKRISNNVRSGMLDRIIKLFSTALKSGGRLAVLLDDLSRDIFETQGLKRDMVTKTKSYAMFVMFTIIFGAPLLLAISIRFLDMVSKFSGFASSGSEFGLGISAGEALITPEFLHIFSIVFLIVTGLLASMLMGVIKEGDPKYGFRYSPIIVGAAIVIFYISKAVIFSFTAGFV